MAKWHLKDAACSVQIEFKKDGEFVIPDQNSVLLTIRKGDGSKLTGYDSVPLLGATSTDFLLPITAEMNAVGGDGLDTRFIEVAFTSGGTPLYFRTSYHLGAFLPLVASPADVRTILGLRGLEVRDEEVDLNFAYYALIRSYSGLTTALTAADDRKLYANQAVTLKAAIGLLPALRLRAVKEDTLNNASLIRANVNWDALREDLEGELASALANITDTSAATYAAPDLLQLSNPTDPVTNA